ncbi:MAG: ATP-binding protein [Gammaproteobacteria bacterium]
MRRGHSPVTQLCLHYLLWLRTLAVGTQLVAVFTTYQRLSIPFPILPVSLVIISLAAFTLCSWWYISAGHPVYERFFSAQLLADIVALTVLLFFTGGSANPFISLLLLPVTVAAATLMTNYRIAIAAAAAACYTALMVAHVPDPHWMHQSQGFAVHMWGMWFGFLLSAGLVVYFVARMGSALREHDRALAQAREQALEAEQLIELGTLAAGTAHELGTPLSTIAVIAGELNREHAQNVAFGPKLRLLREQVMRCKQILARLAARAGQTQADCGHRLPVKDYLEELVADWYTQRPNVKLLTRWEGDLAEPQIIADRTLTQAIVNILNNAADASVEAVELHASWTPEALQIQIHDRGKGIPGGLVERVGSAFVSTKGPDKGMGLGLYLARSTLNRLGGTVQLTPRPDRGVTASIVLPLAPLRATK